MGRLTQRSAAVGLVLSLSTMLVGLSTVTAADSVTLTTPYPAVAVAPGAKVSFDVSVATPASARVSLSVRGAPTGWTAQLFGGGFVVDGVQTEGSKATTVRLDVSVFFNDTATTERINVEASAPGGSTTLPLDIRVTPAAAGEVSLTTDIPNLKGPSSTSFSFSLTLHNDTSEDLTFTGQGSGPAGWTVSTQLSSDSTAASAIVKAGSTTPVTVKATAPDGVTAGQYPMSVDVTSGSRTAHADLGVEVTGSYGLTVTMPDGRPLNANASAGSPTDITFVLTNTGTAPVTGAKLTGTPPSGWTVTFDPATVDIAPQQTASVTAHLTPSKDAIAGDYVTTFNASANEAGASASADIRVTVQTSLLGGLVGIGLIVLVLVGLGWIFLRYGRR